MDEKTEELRDIFMDVSDSETVTETQEATHGSLTDQEEVAVMEELDGVIGRMRERFEFDAELADEEYCRVVRLFYDGASDAAIARDLDLSRQGVFRARLDVHLFRDRDLEAPFDLSTLGEHLDVDHSMTVIADMLDVSPSTVRRYRRVIRARDEARRSNDRFRDEFETILPDADLSTRLTGDVKEDGLDDATEGMETNVSF
ncbi:MAG: DNA-binding CsgD family transcriptional regulator [Halobacteriales archaeon]|jgi:DNA-binding CsgD family transcriptional regulator